MLVLTLIIVLVSNMTRILAKLEYIVELFTARTESSQALTRLLILVPFVFYYVMDHGQSQALGVGYGFAAIVWYVWVKLVDGGRAREMMSIILDVGIITALLWEVGPAHATPFLLYFWLVVDNGYRINSRNALCVIGAVVALFTATINASEVWIYANHHHGLECVVTFMLISLFTYKMMINLESSTEQTGIETLRADVAEEKATIDQLTGLKNREVALNMLRILAARGTRVGVLFVDLDNFKQFNDEHGHHVGDQVLETISRRLKNSVRVPDVVCRYAGDEFVVIVNDEDRETIQTVAERVQSSLNRQIRTSDAASLPVTGSIGVAILGIHGSSAAEVLKNADAAMYMAKRAGRNKISWFEEKISEA